MIMKLETKNLILRKAKEEDLELIYKNVWSDKEVANNELKHYQSSWTDVGIFDITQRNHVRLSNLIYGNS